MTEQPQVNVAGRLAMIERYERLIAESEENLRLMPRCWVVTLSGEVDVTEVEKNRVLGHITTYQKCIEHLSTWE